VWKNIWNLFFNYEELPVLHVALHALTSCTLSLSIAVAADMHGLVTLGGDDTTTSRNYLPQTEELVCWTKNVHVSVSLCTIMFHLVCACVHVCMVVVVCVECTHLIVWGHALTLATEISQGWQPLLPRGSYTTGRVHQPPCDVFMFLHTIGDTPGSFPDSSYTIHISHKGNSVPLSDTIRGLGG